MKRFLASLLFLSTNLPAARLALLVGVADYDPIHNNAGFRKLAGPVNDVSALQNLLTSKWNFRNENVKVLLDKQATRQMILAALDDLAAKAKPGDSVFLYFSGHGTSGLDRKTNYGFGMERSTGAIVPWDVKRTSSAKELLDSLIIAARDLRPRLRKLESVAEVFAVFDACYSGNSIKAIPTAGLEKREGNAVGIGNDSSFLDDLSARREELSQITAQGAAPYQRLMYLSASSASEPAYDVGPAAIAGGRHTFDGQPHGALTSALLEGLNGGATNPDGYITYNSLHQFVTRTVEVQYGQVPRLVYDTGNPDLAKRQIFGEKAPAAPPSSRGMPYRVKFAQPETAVESALRNAPNLVITTGEYDAIVQRGTDRELVLRHASGAEIMNEPAGAAAEFAAAIRGLARAKELADLRFPDQAFSVGLDLIPAEDPAAEREVFYGGEMMSFRLSPEKSSYLFLVNIDRKGYATVIYPSNAVEWKQASRPVRTAANVVSDPFGLEMMKVLAFEQKPPGIEEFAGHPTMPPDSADFQRLLDLVRAAKGGKTEQVRLLYSTKGPKPAN